MRAAALLAAAGLLAASPAAAQDTYFSTLIETRYAFGLETEAVQSAELEVRPAGELALGGAWSLVGEARFRADLLDRLEPGRPEQGSVAPISRRALIGDRAGAELREAYLSYSGLDTSLRIGKQQIVWGQADGIKVLDVVNPQSFREFILDEFDQSRTPLWSVLAERTVGGVDVQGFWILDRTYNEAPPRGGVFALSAPDFVPSLAAPPRQPVAVRPVDRPEGALDASEVGFQVSGLVGGWSGTLNYLYHYEDTPYFDLEPTPKALQITPRFNRVHQFGATYANSFGDLTLRGELSYTAGASVPTFRLPTEQGPPPEADTFEHVIGLDYFGAQDTFVSAQLFQSVRLEEVERAVAPDVSSFATLLVRRDLGGGSWNADLRWLAGLNDDGGLARAALSYFPDDAVRLSAGIDVFYGDADGVFGQFDDADRLTFTASHAF